MQWLLVNVQMKQLNHPYTQVVRVDSVQEAERRLLVIRPDVIIVSDQDAAAILNLVMAMGLKLRVAVVTEDDSAHNVRHWCGLGASFVCSSQWETELLSALGIEIGQEKAELAPPFLPRGSWYGEGPLIVAVAGAYAGAGTTHTALLLSKYLSRRYRNVAIWEANHRSCFEFMEYMHTGNRSIRQRVDIDGVTFFKATADIEWLENVASDFDAIVLDLGVLDGNQPWFFRAQVPILVGSASEWRQHELLAICHKFTVRQDRWRIALPLSTSAGLEDMQEMLTGRTVFAIPVHQDPFVSQADTDAALDEVLFPVDAAQPLSKWNRLTKHFKLRSN